MDVDVGQKKIEQSSGGNGESEQWKYEKCFRRSFGKSLREVVLDLDLGKVRSGEQRAEHRGGRDLKSWVDHFL